MMGKCEWFVMKNGTDLKRLYGYWIKRSVQKYDEGTYHQVTSDLCE